MLRVFFLIFLFAIVKIRQLSRTQIGLYFLGMVLPLALIANSEALFPEDADLTLHTHVNVISGHLNLHFQDVLIHGAAPLSLTRTYSSSSSLERGDEYRTLQRSSNNWIFQGGWTFLPHVNLLVTGGYDQPTLYLPEKSGTLIRYVFEREVVEKNGEKKYLFKSDVQGGQSGLLSAKYNARNNVLHFWPDKPHATVFLPDGGTQDYAYFRMPHAAHFYSGTYEFPFFLHLTAETLPNRHRIVYSYDKQCCLKDVALKNPQETKTFSSFRCNIVKKVKPGDDTGFYYHFTTSDHKAMHYRSFSSKNIHYLCDVESNCRPREIHQFIGGRKGTGFHLHAFTIEDHCQFKAHYYEPENQKENRKWARKEKYKPLKIDKVSLIEGPMGDGDAFIPIAHFSYEKNRTDVRDVDNLLTRYTHDGNVLKEVEYFDKDDRSHSLLRLYWESSRLQAKAHLHTPSQALFSKTFKYDEAGNVITETLYGNLTGKTAHLFSIDAQGTLQGAESYTKRYTYLPHFNVPLTEEEEEGPIYRYAYKPATNLLTARLICDQDKIILRQFHFYDEDHLLICTIDDDGNTPDSENLEGVSERHIQRSTRDPQTGMTTECSESYLDLLTHEEKLLKRTAYSYSPENRVISEAIYDKTNTYRYTLHTDYDAQGRMISKTTPLGQTHTYTYDQHGQLIDCKEIGKSRILQRYNAAGQPTVREEIGQDQKNRFTYTDYDAKGRLVYYIDPRGNGTAQNYDAFGRCIMTEFPLAKNQNGIPYKAQVHFHYDLLGNLTYTTCAGLDSARTIYTTLKKPICITQNDGTVLLHEYNKNGTLAKTIFPDGVEVHYTYDILQRMTAKRTVDADQLLCAEEIWTYNAFHLLTHTLENGRALHYRYDSAGRKIAEISQERFQTFTYDLLGFLEKTSDGVIARIQIHDAGGRVVEEYIEDKQNQCIENHMVFTYDGENRKVSAQRLTSQGMSLDTFSYDGQGRLCRHEDPLGNVTQFIHSTVQNEAYQALLQKHTTDPLGNQKVESFDALSRCTSIHNLDPNGNTVAWEEYGYDSAGNKRKRTTHIFQGITEVKQITTLWEYDSCGRVIEEIESGQKVTRYAYDARGRISCKTLPDATQLFYTYDSLGRLVQLRSTDGTVHYQYTYAKNKQPTLIVDLLTQQELRRTYNHFDQVIEETNPEGLLTRWQYDMQGRCTQIYLPDSSSIAYVYSGIHLSAVQRLNLDGDLLYEHRYTVFDSNGHVTQESMIQGLGEQTTLHDLLERPIMQTCPLAQQSVLYGPSGLVMATQNSLLGDKTFAYDPLNQMIQESKVLYQFNSIGNPLAYTIDNCNRILSTSTTTFSYDLNGNPLQRTTDDTTTHYTYDALGRLTSITTPEECILYRYDPLSRLSSKEILSSFKKEKRLYLYDHDVEIGTSTPDHRLLELKVLGLGVKQDIGAAIAIELCGQTYAPLHDLNGNIIALLSSSGIVESYPTNAFGKESCTTPPLNPWRFCSKRAESQLIFFGKRFYDSSLGRWLTPDPAGFTEGPNLYLYVLNSPLNRLDLFGLTSLRRFPNGSLDEKSIDIPLSIADLQAASHSTTRELLYFKDSTDGVTPDYFVACGHWHKLEYTPEEIECGTVNIFDHLHEIMPKDGIYVGLVTAQNGMKNGVAHKSQMDKSVIAKIPESVLFIGIYNPTEGLFGDLKRISHELSNRETPIVTKTRQFMEAIVNRIHSINPDLLWMHITHSEGGLIQKNAHEGMPLESKELLQQHLLAYSFGPAKPLPKSYAKETNNIYSTKDYLTKCLAPKENDSDYKITMRNCETPIQDRNWFFIDHSFAGQTYQNALDEQIKDTRKIYGFYNNQTR